MQFFTNKEIGRYEVLEFLGSGSQGSVYLAKDPNLERRVAIKILSFKDDSILSPDSERSALEGRIAGALKHPNIVSVFDAGDIHGAPYLVFEYVQGRTLFNIIEDEGSRSIESAVSMIGQIIDAIAFAHAEGIVHLDLSPRNILIDRNNIPRIMDFGLSQYTNNMPERTDSAIGTLRYMSPEHMSGKKLGPYTDVFALASIFYELVTGIPTLDHQDAFEIMRRLRDETVDLQRIRELQHGQAFARFLKRALENDYRLRYRDGDELKKAFGLFLKDSGLADKTPVKGIDQHSTVHFLLRRMLQKEEFPMMSKTLSEINRLADEGSSASVDHLATVILRDYALTKKLLTLVNSAYYRGVAGEVTDISRAIVILGLSQVRMTASGLVYVGQMNRECDELKYSIARSFLSGLIARRLATKVGLANSEEAFICGLFQNLGEHLTIYYFREDYAAICKLSESSGADRLTVSETVLGIGFDKLGAAVARTWRLPESIEKSILGSVRKVGGKRTDRTEQLAFVANFSNDLTGVASKAEAVDGSTPLRRLIRKFEDDVPVTEQEAWMLLSDGMDEFAAHARLFDIDVKHSKFCGEVADWIDRQRALLTVDSCPKSID